MPLTVEIVSLPIGCWKDVLLPDMQMHALRNLESGNVIFMPQLAFNLLPKEQDLLSPSFLAGKAKNISFDQQTDTLRGACGDLASLERLKNMVSRFAMQARDLVHQLFPYYQEHIQMARTSYRPAPVEHRKTSYRKDDTLLHVDAFPATPNQGRRILRVFSNINLQGVARVWRLGESFERVVQRFLPMISRPWPGSACLLHGLRLTRSRRSEYDHIMLQMHHRMKKDSHYQRQASQIEFCFPACSSWIVQTDQVSHAAMSGQHLLEQTFYLPVHAMAAPEQAPLKVLERLLNRTLVPK